MTASNRVVYAINLGRMGFLKAYDIQLRYARDHLDYLGGRRRIEGRNILLLVEHNPVFTVGVRTHGYHKVSNCGLHQGALRLWYMSMHGEILAEVKWLLSLFMVWSKACERSGGTWSSMQNPLYRYTSCAYWQLPALLHTGRGQPTVSHCASVGIHVHLYSWGIDIHMLVVLSKDDGKGGWNWSPCVQNVGCIW